MKKHITAAIGLLLLSGTVLTNEAQAQWGHRGGYYGRHYGYSARPRVSIGIGGIFGGGWGYGPGVGVSVGLPGVGVYINSLPTGYRTVYLGGRPYYYNNDRYYIGRNGGGYEAIDAPLGASLNRLPAGATQQLINGQPYYEYKGTFFLEDTDADGRPVYIVVGKNGSLNTSEAMRRRDSNYNAPVDNTYNNNGSHNGREIIVRNANEDDDNANGDAVYGNAGPQPGDQFDKLPNGSRSVNANGQTLYVSPSGTYYKPVYRNGQTIYEVTRAR